MSGHASLNHIYRTVWNQALGAMVAVAEITSSGGCCKGVSGTSTSRRPRLLLFTSRFAVLSLGVAMAWGLNPSVALANPSGGVAIVGQAGMVNQGNKLTVTTQNGAGTNYSAINWQSFSIPSGSTTYFQQPSATSTSINRVVTNTPSQLFGTLGSNGNLVLVNQSGIAVGAGAVVDTAGFTAASLRMSDADALAGRLMFGDGLASSAGVSVQGRILARSGDVVLLGSSVDTGKDALIQAPNGSTILAAGRQIELTGRGLEGISLQVQAPTDQAVNLGTLKGDAVAIFAGTLRHSGLIQATTAALEGGKVVLKASGDAYVEGTGTITATGTKGGSVDVLGNRVAVTDQAAIDVSGEQGGGTVRVGGDYQGKNSDVQNASITYFGQQASIKADATVNGDGGKVIVWADDTTRAYGSISARGGEQGGNGGFVENSGRRYLDFQGRVDTRAPQGLAGTLLLDPSDIEIATGPNATLGTGTVVDPFYGIATGGWSNLEVGRLVTALGGGNVVVDATKGSVGSGNIRVSTPVTWATNALTLQTSTSGSIAINAAMTATGTGSVKLDAGSGGITQTAAIQVSTLEVLSVGNVSLSSSNLVGTVAANVTAGTAGTFTFRNSDTGGLTIGTVGSTTGVTASGAVDLQDASSSGGISVAQSVKSTGSSVTLNTGGGAISGAGTIEAATINLQSSGGSGAIGSSATPLKTSSLGGAGNSASIAIGLSGTSASGPNAVYLTHTGDATLTSVTTTGTATPVDISVTGSLTASGISAGTADLSLSSGSKLTLARSAVLTGKNITLTADIMDLSAAASINGGANSGDVVWLKPKTSTTKIDLGSAVDTTAGTLELSSAELGHLSGGGTLRLGAASATGTLNLSAALRIPSTGSFGVLSLETGAELTQASTATITANSLSIKSKGNVALDTASNSVGALAGSITGAGTEYFHFKNTGALTVDSVAGVAGIGISSFANYTAGSANGVIALQSDGNITQTSGAGLSGAAVWASSSGGSVDLTAASNGNGTGVLAGSASSGFAYKSSNTVALMDVNGHSGISNSSTGNILLSGAGFSNKLTTPFSLPSTGRWFIYVPDPGTVTKGGLTSNFRHYNATYATYSRPAETTGNGFIYASTPGSISVDTTLTSGAASNTYGDVPTAVFGSKLVGTFDSEDISGTATFTPLISSTTSASSYTVSYAGGLKSASGFSGAGTTTSVSYTLVAGNGLAYTVDTAKLGVINATLTGAVYKTYDGTTSAALNFSNFQLGGFVGTDSATVTKTSGTYASQDVGQGILVSTSLASSDFSLGSGTVFSNYTWPTGASGNIGNIGQASLTVSANSVGKTYDRIRYSGGNGVVYSGFVNGESTAVLGGALSYAGSSQGAVSAGSYTITPSGLTSGNYSIDYGDGTLTVSKAAISGVSGITANNKIYDGSTIATLNTARGTLSGLIGGDSVAVAGATGSFSDKNVGVGKTVTITGLSLSGADAANYTFGAATTSATADISKAVITGVAGIAANSKVYDGSTSATVDMAKANLAGAVSGDKVSVSAATAAFSDKNAGVGKAVSVQGLNLTGADAGNYALGVSTASAVGDISKAAITGVSGITANNKVYDGKTSATLNIASASLAGVLRGDSVSVGAATGNFSDKNVGTGKTVSITGLSLSGVDAGNYALGGGTASTVADISKAAITGVSGITASSKVYDGTTSATLNTTSANLLGAISGDGLSVAGATGSFADKNAGVGKTVSITNLSLGGVDAPNYLLTGAAAAAQADITRAPLTGFTGIVINDKVYDGTVVATATATGASFAGMVSGDKVTVGAVVAAFSDRNVGVGKAVSVSSLSLSGPDAANYTVESNIAPTKGSITVRPLSTWTAAGSGAWGSTGNWDALPDASNVQAVSIPAGVSVTYDAAVGTTRLQSVNSAGGLLLTGGDLSITNGLTTAQYSQTGGVLSVAGALAVNNSFSQSSGSISAGGPVSITQSTGNLTVGAISAPTISLAAPSGNIGQSAALVAAGLLTTLSQGSTILNHSGNRIGSFNATSTGVGDIGLTNVGVIDVQGIHTAAGNVTLYNTGGISTSGAVVANGGKVSMTANSPLTIGTDGVTATGDITLVATNLTSAGNLTLNGDLTSSAGAVALSAANNLAQNSKVSAARGISVSAGGTLTLGPNATSFGNPMSYTSQGAPVAAPPGSQTLSGSAPSDFVAAFLTQFESAVVSQETVIVELPGVSDKDKKTTTAEGEICLR